MAQSPNGSFSYHYRFFDDYYDAFLGFLTIMASFWGFLTIMTSFLGVLDYYDEFWGVLDYYDEFWGFLDYYDEFGNSRADFFEPGSRIPLPRSPGADFFETGSRNPPPQGAKRPGAPPKAAPGGFLEPVSKNSAPVDLGRGISTSENPWFLEPLVFRGRDAYMEYKQTPDQPPKRPLC